MSGEVDYYDVQAMIRDARSEIRGEIGAAIREACRALRDDLSSEIDSLERTVLSLHRTLDERTGHLV